MFKYSDAQEGKSFGNVLENDVKGNQSVHFLCIDPGGRSDEAILLSRYTIPKRDFY